MAIQIGGTTVIDDGRNILNVGIITATTINATSFSGDGSLISGVVAEVEVAVNGEVVGTQASLLDFRGTGISTASVNSGIATVVINTGSLTIQKDGSTIGASVNNIDLRGSGISSVTVGSGIATVISDTALTLKNNGIVVGTTNNIDFIGVEITATGSASTITVSAGSDITSSLFS